MKEQDIPFSDEEIGWNAEDEQRYRKLFVNSSALSDKELEHYKRMETDLNDPPMPYGDPCNEPPNKEEIAAELERLRNDPTTYPTEQEQNV